MKKQFARIALIFTPLLIVYLMAVSMSAAGSTNELHLPIVMRSVPDLVNLTVEPAAPDVDFVEPTSIAHADDDRLFITERRGLIRILFPDGTDANNPFLDIRNLVTTNHPEEGLLGLAFDPDYATNGTFYVTYIDRTLPVNNNVLARYQVNPGNPNRADPASGEVLIAVPQVRSYHNGGDLHFGPDGMLYWGLGDSGSVRDGAGEEKSNPMDLDILLGKLLRLDVNSGLGSVPAECAGDGSGNYAIPADNPYVASNSAAQCDEVWASGLRNPWRFSFDRLTGDLYIADVGEDTREEVNVVLSGTPGGLNFGWPCREGTLDVSQLGYSFYDPAIFGPLCNSQPMPFTPPVVELAHSDPICNSVTGGYVYRGTQQDSLYGRYVFSDFCPPHRLWTLTQNGQGQFTLDWVSTAPGAITAFGEGVDGEIYLLEYTGTNSPIYHLVSTP